MQIKMNEIKRKRPYDGDLIYITFGVCIRIIIIDSYYLNTLCQSIDVFIMVRAGQTNSLFFICDLSVLFGINLEF